MEHRIHQPYLVIPKLILQPTWGGEYIAKLKGWDQLELLKGKRIGQSYELFDKSSLSLITDSTDPDFMGEITDPKTVETQSHPPHTLSIQDLINQSPEQVLGKRYSEQNGSEMKLLLKFTQALGNSFQLHVPDGTNHPRWKAKPESWYYFEPGLITCGVKSSTDWDAYKKAVTELDRKIQTVALQVKNASLDSESAQKQIHQLIRTYDPWQYVNLVQVEKGTLLDLSPCGIHHSWEEDLKTIPLGNVLYEIQVNVMDEVATIRNFDKGKMGKDGKLRPLQIEEYFTFADRSPEANNPETHMRNARLISQTDRLAHEELLHTKHYSLERILMYTTDAEHTVSIDSFRHMFVKSGTVILSAGDGSVIVSAGHSGFVPAGCGSYAIQAREANTEILISY